MTRRSLQALLVVATSLLPVGGWAEPLKADAAATALREGKEAYLEGLFDDAVAKLAVASKARAAKVQVQALYFLGMALHAQQKRAQAETAFRRLFSIDPTFRVDTARLHPDVSRLLLTVRRQLRGSLVVRDAQGARAAVIIDGQRRGSTPFRGDLGIGRHVLELKYQGKLVLRRDLLIRAGREARVDLRLPKLVSVRRKPARLWTWIALAGSLAGSGVAIGLGVAANGAVNDADALASGGFSPADLDRRDSLLGRADRLALGSNIAWGVAGALFVTSVVLFFTEQDLRTEEIQLGTVRIDGNGLALAF